jgi:hypothetical protein
MHSAQRICWTQLLFSALAQLLLILSIAPHPTNALSFLSHKHQQPMIPCQKVFFAAVTPLWMAGVLLKTMSIATRSFCRLMFHAGKGEVNVATSHQILCQEQTEW